MAALGNQCIDSRGGGSEVELRRFLVAQEWEVKERGQPRTSRVCGLSKGVASASLA